MVALYLKFSPNTAFHRSRYSSSPHQTPSPVWALAGTWTLSPISWSPQIRCPRCWDSQESGTWCKARGRWKILESVFQVDGCRSRDRGRLESVQQLHFGCQFAFRHFKLHIGAQMRRTVIHHLKPILNTLELKIEVQIGIEWYTCLSVQQLRQISPLKRKLRWETVNTSRDWVRRAACPSPDTSMSLWTPHLKQVYLSLSLPLLQVATTQIFIFHWTWTRVGKHNVEICCLIL